MIKKTRTATREKAKPVPAALGRDVQAKIGQQLRALHDDVVREGIPPRFQELLARLDSGKKD